MKKVLCLWAIMAFMAFSVPAFAAWDVEVSSIRTADRKCYFSVTFTSDGTDPAAIDLLDEITFTGTVKGSLLQFMYVDPGTAAVAPDTTIDITVTDQNGYELWSDTGISNTAGSWHQMWGDLGDYPPILSELNIDFNDIGSDGDQVTLYFICILE